MNKRFIPISALVLTLAVFDAEARSLSIGVDKSRSNPLLADPHFAKIAAEHAYQAIAALKDGDSVTLKNFGSRREASNMLYQTVRIDQRHRASEVARLFASYIGALPKQSATAQDSTNLIAYLRYTPFDCAAGGEVIVLTDAVESSSLIDGTKLLEGKAKLPDPGVDLKGCKLTLFGLGGGLEEPHIGILKAEWTRWAERAGAQFTAVVP